MQRVQADCQPKLLPGLVYADLKTVRQRVIVTISADRDPARPEACFKNDGDDGLKSSHSLPLSGIQKQLRVIRQLAFHQDAAVDVEDHHHAQCSTAVFAADACLMALRLRSHAAAEPEGPASMQPHQPLHAIECRP
jgi:hypothetical protein